MLNEGGIPYVPVRSDRLRQGGVGKSVFTTEDLGAALARRGASVVVVDADIGLRSGSFSVWKTMWSTIWSMSRRKTVCSMPFWIVHSVPGLKSCFPRPGFARVRSLEAETASQNPSHAFGKGGFRPASMPLQARKGLRNLLNAGPDEAILIATPDDICIRDVERTAGILESKGIVRPNLVVNRLDNELIARREMFSARVVADSLDLPLLGKSRRIPPSGVPFSAGRLFLDLIVPPAAHPLRIAARLMGTRFPSEIGRAPVPAVPPSVPEEEKLKEVTPIDRY